MTEISKSIFFIIKILLHPNDYREEALQLSATICLCKYMLLSVELCETHAKMLFDLLKNSTFRKCSSGNYGFNE